jgi:hypothetical protein
MKLRLSIRGVVVSCVIAIIALSSAGSVEAQDQQSQIQPTAAATGDGAAVAGPRPESKEAKRKSGFASFLGGIYYWPDLAHLQPTTGLTSKYGDFQKWGYNLEFGGYYRMARFRDRDVRIGGELGFFFSTSSNHVDTTIMPAGRTARIDLNSRGIYLTPGVRYFFGKRTMPRFYVGGGSGLYGMDVVTMMNGGTELDTYYEKYTFGGYVSGGVSIPVSQSHPKWTLIFEVKTHFVHFGEAQSFATNTEQLSGPINIFQVGLGFGE